MSDEERFNEEQELKWGVNRYPQVATNRAFSRIVLVTDTCLIVKAKDIPEGNVETVKRDIEQQLADQQVDIVNNTC